MATEQDAKIIEKVVEGFNAHDVERILQYFAPDAEFYSSVGSDIHGDRAAGTDELRRTFQARFDEVPDMQWHGGDMWICEDGIAARFHATGTFARDGSKLDSWGCDFWKLRDGKVILKDTFYKIRT